MQQTKENLRKIDNKREANYDLLRIICAIAVIMIHVSGLYKNAITNDEFFGQLYKEHMISVLLYNTLSRFAVPCFVMLSGAFLLADDRNLQYNYFYKKCMKSVGVQIVIFSILYFLYSEVLVCVKIVMRGEELSELVSPIRSVINGAPFYHMWYMYTLLGIYLLIPVILNVKKSIGEEAFSGISVVILLVASISGWTSSFKLHWSIAKVICYVGYVIMGYQLRRCYKNRKNNRRGVLLIILGIVAEFILTYIQYGHSLIGLAEADEKYSIVSNFNPLVVIASVLIFMGFSQIRINYNFEKISSQTFNIYLFHAGVWSLLSQIVRGIGVEGDARIIIPTSIVLVFFISALISIIYTKLWNKIESQYSISEWLCKVLKLS